MKNCKVLGVPFTGNKSKIAIDLLKTIFDKHPDVTDFYDLCGGGGCVSFTASILKNNITIHYNEIREEIYNLINFIINNDSIPSDWWNWVTREEFFNCRNKTDAKSAMVKLIWSFGNRGISGSYLYSKEITNIKKIGHEYVIFNTENSKNKLLSEYGIKVSNDIANQMNRRLELQNQAKKIKLNFGNIFRMLHIERLEKVESCFKIKNIKTTNKSYEEVEIKGNKPIIYLDIPYKETVTYDGVKFDYERFYNWVKNCKYPVYFSEYQAPKDFECIWQKEKFCSMSAQMNSRSIKIEKLYWNGVK